jgi:hypothetical protein
MVGVAIADMYLDHLLYQIWRSGFFCLAIDSYGLNLIGTDTLSMIIPSVGSLAGGDNLPARIELHPQGVIYAEVGKGTFYPDHSVQEPILFLFMPELRMDFWMKTDGRWVQFLSLSQTLELRLALEFTPDNKVIPILDENSVVASDVRLLNYELLAESEQDLEAVVPRLVGFILPLLSDTLANLEIPDLQGFGLQIKALQGDVQRADHYYEFMSIYADLSFTPPPSPVTTRVRLSAQDPRGVLLALDDPGVEVQARFDEGFWSPFRHGSLVRFNADLLAGKHLLDVRGRRIGDYRSLDPRPVRLQIDTGRAGSPLKVGSQAGPAGCSTAVPGHWLGLLWGLALVWMVRRKRRTH